LGILAACSSSEEATTTTTAPAATATTAAGSTTTTAAPEVTATEEAVVADTGPVYGGILYAAMENDAPGMSPMYDSSITRAYMWWPMYNRLWAADPLDMSQNVNDLVKEYTITNGGKTYNITLHEGVKFHNGETLTADDVKARYEIQECDLPEGRSAPKGTTSKLLTGYPDRDCDDFKSASPTIGLKVIDDTNIEWTLSRASNSFTDYIYQHAVSPRSVLQKDDETKNMSGKEDTPEDNVGTGPFKYVVPTRFSVQG
jgi:ABC-type transport system substrate-binding protein